MRCKRRRVSTLALCSSQATILRHKRISILAIRSSRPADERLECNCTPASQGTAGTQEICTAAFQDTVKLQVILELQHANKILHVHVQEALFACLLQQRSRQLFKSQHFQVHLQHSQHETTSQGQALAVITQPRPHA
jgi:hypothetical protein